MEEDYQVGQIIFLIGEKTTRVLPIQVVEEVVRTTVEGKIKTYTVQMPDKKQTTVDIYSLKGTLFKSTDELREYMFSNAKNAINTMITEAARVSEEVFDVYEKLEDTIKQSEETVPEEHSYVSALPDNKVVQPANEDGIIRVDLGNGKFAKMKSSALEQPTK